jgi:hypothetical protein
VLGDTPISSSFGRNFTVKKRSILEVPPHGKQPSWCLHVKRKRRGNEKLTAPGTANWGRSGTEHVPTCQVKTRVSLMECMVLACLTICYVTVTIPFCHCRYCHAHHVLVLNTMELVVC